MDDNLRVALYARVSTERQAEELTIQSQVAALQQRIQADGVTLEKVLRFLDDGYSGTTLVRPALERLRDLAYCGGVDRLYVYAPDRLARHYAYQVVLLEEFRKHQVEVKFINDIAPLDSPEGNLLVQMQGMIAEFERARSWNAPGVGDALRLSRARSAPWRMRLLVIAMFPSMRPAA